MNLRYLRVSVFIIIMLFLCTGCLYPEERRLQLDQLDQHVSQVQSAVERYYQDQHLLPYRYTDEDEKLTTHYKVDFRELKDYVGQIPPSAFEQGGYFIYLLVDVEEEPKVKLFDLRVNEAVEKVRPYVLGYYQRHKKWPLGQEVQPNFYQIDYQALKIDPVTFPSPYSVESEIPLLMDQEGRIWADYRVDVMKKWQAANEKPDPETDLRDWLREDSHFVAAFSPTIQMKDETPVLMIPKDD